MTILINKVEATGVFALACKRIMAEFVLSPCVGAEGAQGNRKENQSIIERGGILERWSCPPRLPGCRTDDGVETFSARNCFPS